MNEVKIIMRIMNDKMDLEKLREESEQRRLRALLENEADEKLAEHLEINKLLEGVKGKLLKIKEVLPDLNIRLVKNKPTFGVALLGEWSPVGDKIPYAKSLDLDDLQDTLVLFDDVIENPEKYKKRYELSKAMYEQFKLDNGVFKGFSVLTGSFTYKNKYSVDLKDDLGLRVLNSDVLGTLEDDGTFRLNVEVQSELTKDFGVNSDTSSLDIGLLPELYSVKLETNAKYVLKGVKVDDVLATIKRMENLVRVRLDNTKGFENSEQ